MSRPAIQARKLNSSVIVSMRKALPSAKEKVMDKAAEGALVGEMAKDRSAPSLLGQAELVTGDSLIYAGTEGRTQFVKKSSTESRLRNRRRRLYDQSTS